MYVGATSQKRAPLTLRIVWSIRHATFGAAAIVLPDCAPHIASELRERHAMNAR
jgi:hypothetical protein